MTLLHIAALGAVANLAIAVAALSLPHGVIGFAVIAAIVWSR
jgi:hypothetical protein